MKLPQQDKAGTWIKMFAGGEKDHNQTTTIHSLKQPTINFQSFWLLVSMRKRNTWRLDERDLVPPKSSTQSFAGFRASYLNWKGPHWSWVGWMAEVMSTKPFPSGRAYELGSSKNHEPLGSGMSIQVEITWEWRLIFWGVLKKCAIPPPPPQSFLLHCYTRFLRGGTRFQV